MTSSRPSLRARRSNPWIAASLTLLAMTSLGLSSCLTPTGTQRGADVVRYGGRPGAGSTGIHTVLGGDTVYTVAQRYNLPLREIISLNDLSPPYHLANGYRLKLPPPNEYNVHAGDTLNSVSRLFATSVSEIAKTNNLAEPYKLSVGQVLRLPSPQPALQEEFAANTPPPVFTMETETAAPVPVGGVESEVLAPPSGTVKTASGTLAPVATTSPSNVKPAAGFPPQPIAKNVDLPAEKVQAQKVAAVMPSIAPKVPPRVGNGRFMRPVDGKVISGYGPKPDGLHNDGINIKAPRGMAVRAADNGVVAYTGSEMSGYGNLVLIRHQDRWMTAYAHMDKILVKKGDVVKAGQSIGTVGSTGQVDSSQLHFEVRKGTEAVDPSRYL